MKASLERKNSLETQAETTIDFVKKYSIFPIILFLKGMEWHYS